MEQRTRKLMMIHKILYPRDDVEEKKEEDSPALKIASMHQYEDSMTT